MSGRFVRASKYRHVYGQPGKKELCYDNIKISTNAWDSNLIKANGKYISVNWNTSGGGAFAVIPVNEVGKAPDQVSLFRGHTATVLDTDFNPFNDNIIISGSDDTKLGVWKIPDDYSFHNYTDENGDIKDVSPVALYSGHKRKIGHVQFHPTAENVAATSSLDYTIKLWDIENGKDKITLEHKDLVTSFSFNYNGNLLATTSRDRKLRVWDIRANKIISEGPAHTGAKSSRVVWLGNSDRIGTTGFSRMSDRQLGIWDSSNIGAGPIGGFYSLDSSAGILIPFYDDSNKILYVGGKGDGNIRYYEFQNDELFPLSELQSIEPQRGLAVTPKRTVNVQENEILRAYKTVGDQAIEPISFIVPRKSDVFQNDIYPETPSNKSALSSKEWFDGKSVNGPVLFSLESLFNANKSEFKPSSIPDSIKNNEEIKPGIEKKELKAKTEKEELEKEKVKHEPKIVSPIASSGRSTPKTDLDTLLQKQEVNSLLKKAADLDEGKESKEESNWDEEDSIKMAEPVKVEKKEEQKLVSKEIKDEQNKQEPKLEPVKEAPKLINSSNSTTLEKPLTLKCSIEKLNSIVEHFEQIVARLEAANLEKDERLKALEIKVEELTKK